MGYSKMSVFPAESGKPGRSLLWRNWLIQGAVGAGTAVGVCTTTVLWAGSSHSLSYPVPYPPKEQQVHAGLWQGSACLGIYMRPDSEVLSALFLGSVYYHFPWGSPPWLHTFLGLGIEFHVVKCQVDKWSTSVLSIRSRWAGLLWNSAIQSHLQAGQVGMPSPLFLLLWASTGTGAKWWLCKGSIVSPSPVINSHLVNGPALICWLKLACDRWLCTVPTCHSHFCILHLAAAYLRNVCSKIAPQNNVFS